jgi:hypothetical protein
MSNINLATECVNHMVGLLRAVPGYTQKVYHVATEQELVDRFKTLNDSVIGVLYEGLRPTAGNEGGRPGSSGGGGGTSSDLNLAVIMFFRNETMGSTDYKLKYLTEVDTLRRALLRQRAPSGHFWRFMVEAYVAGKDGRLAIIQRWSTTVQLT